MCGRYTLKTPAKELAELFGRPALPFPDYRPRYNVLPRTTSPVLRVRDGEPEVATPEWGLLPRFVADPKGCPRPINARAETLDTNGFFKQAFARRRCLIPADGFYEPEEDDARTQKEKKTGRWFYFRLPGDPPFAFAGLWETWGEGEAYLETYTLVTTDPNGLTASVGHKRSPVIVPPEKHDLWLDPAAKPAQLKKLFAPYVPEGMYCHLTNGKAKNPRAEGPDLIEPVEE